MSLQFPKCSIHLAPIIMCISNLILHVLSLVGVYSDSPDDKAWHRSRHFYNIKVRCSHFPLLLYMVLIIFATSVEKHQSSIFNLFPWLESILPTFRNKPIYFYPMCLRKVYNKNSPSPLEAQLLVPISIVCKQNRLLTYAQRDCPRKDLIPINIYASFP